MNDNVLNFGPRCSACGKRHSADKFARMDSFFQNGSSVKVCDDCFQAHVEKVRRDMLESGFDPDVFDVD